MPLDFGWIIWREWQCAVNYRCLLSLKEFMHDLVRPIMIYEVLSIQETRHLCNGGCFS